MEPPTISQAVFGGALQGVSWAWRVRRVLVVPRGRKSLPPRLGTPILPGAQGRQQCFRSWDEEGGDGMIHKHRYS